MGERAPVALLDAAAAKLEPPKEVKLKDPKDWKVAGKPLYQLLGGRETCYHPVLEFGELAAHPQIRARRMLVAEGGPDPFAEVLLHLACSWEEKG